jgi:hypothetical protein
MRREGTEMKRIFAVAFLVLVLVGSALAQGDAELLRYTFEAGQQLKTIETVQGTIPIQMHVDMPEDAAQGDQDLMLQTAIDTTAIKLLDVVEVNADGVARCKLKIDYMVISSNTTQGQNVIPYKAEFQDGKLTVTGGGPQNQMTQEKQQKLEELLNTEFLLDVTPLGEVQPVGADFERVFSELLGGNFSGMNFRQISRLNAGLPEQAVNIGDSWDYVVEAEEGNVFSGQSNSTLTNIVDENGARVAKINATSYFKMEDFQPIQPQEEAEGEEAAEGEQPADAGFGLAGIEMSIGFMDVSSAVEMSFDLGLGQVVRATGDTTMNMDQAMSMDLGALLGGEDAGGDTKIDMTFQIRDAKMNLTSTTEVVE